MEKQVLNEAIELPINFFLLGDINHSRFKEEHLKFKKIQCTGIMYRGPKEDNDHNFCLLITKTEWNLKIGDGLPFSVYIFENLDEEKKYFSKNLLCVFKHLGLAEKFCNAFNESTAEDIGKMEFWTGQHGGVSIVAQSDPLFGP